MTSAWAPTSFTSWTQKIASSCVFWRELLRHWKWLVKTFFDSIAVTIFSQSFKSVPRWFCFHYKSPVSSRRYSRVFWAKNKIFFLPFEWWNLFQGDECNWYGKLLWFVFSCWRKFSRSCDGAVAFKVSAYQLTSAAAAPTLGSRAKKQWRCRTDLRNSLAPTTVSSSFVAVPSFRAKNKYLLNMFHSIHQAKSTSTWKEKVSSVNVLRNN